MPPASIPARVLVFGTFDNLHPGHRYFLSHAVRRGQVTVVVARDANVRSIKGEAPEQDEERRCSAVRAAFPEATVVLGDTKDFLAPVRSVEPDVILLGYDQKLPPGVREEDLPCPVERIAAFQPEIFKSSLRRKKREGGRK